MSQDRSLKANVLTMHQTGTSASQARDQTKAPPQRTRLLGLEGIVSKKLDAPYKSGPSKAWLTAVGKPIMRIAAGAFTK
jgi:ATP-dependent DNA ligase